jgi:hypothetical protein
MEIRTGHAYRQPMPSPRAIGPSVNRREFIARSAALTGAALLSPTLAGAGTPSSEELANASVSELGSYMQRGELSAIDIARSYLARIDQLDRRGPMLGAMIELNPDALDIAGQRDAERKAGRERLDAQLVSFAPAEAALRLRLGQVLDVLGRGGHFELGFSSLGAYALERCDRSVRWVEAARCLARRLAHLPELRRAMTLGGAFGSVSWSMDELLARVAQPQNEGPWIEMAQSRTVRETRGRSRRSSPERPRSGS